MSLKINNKIQNVNTKYMKRISFKVLHILFMVGRWLASAILSFSPPMKLALDYYSK